MNSFIRLGMMVLVAASASVSAQSPRPPAADNSPLIAATAEAAVSCAAAAGPESIDRNRFAGSDEWVADEQLPGFRHISLPVTITISAADAGAAPQCVVNATLASQNDQRQLALALRAVLPQPPVDQDGGELWRFGRSPNGRSLFMVHDTVRTQPEIRFVGMAF